MYGKRHQKSAEVNGALFSLALESRCHTCCLQQALSQSGISLGIFTRNGDSSHLDLINWGYNKSVDIECDQTKREKTLLERGQEFACTDKIFAGIHFTGEDVGVNYQETRLIRIGWLDERLVVLV